MVLSDTHPCVEMPDWQSLEYRLLAFARFHTPIVKNHSHGQEREE
jgi:hypothetical protein